jgi:hypothetical protein
VFAIDNEGATDAEFENALRGNDEQPANLRAIGLCGFHGATSNSVIGARKGH